MRLTKEIRENIIAAAICASDAVKLNTELDADLKALAKLAYKLTVKIPAALENLTKAEKAEWLIAESAIALDHPGFQYWGNRRDDDDTLSRYLPFDDPVVVPRHQGAVRAADYPELQAAADAAVVKHKAALKYEQDLTAKLWAIVNSTSTVKQLAELWPEGVEFLPPIVAKSTALVPIDTVKAVNATLKLPRTTATTTATAARTRKKG